jgi:hypothetical protein
MKKKYAACLQSVTLLLMMAVTSTAFCQQSPTEKYLLQLHEKKFRWMVEKKTDSLSSILDERVMYIHSNGWTENKKEVIEDLQNGKLTMKSVKVNEASVRVFKNNTGVITGKGLFNVVMNDKVIELNLYYTEVYVKKKNNWMLISRHACRL